jgi:hypothetical protein
MSDNSHEREGAAQLAHPLNPFQILRADEYGEHYANSIGIHLTASDFRLIFGTMGESPQPERDPRPLITNHTAIFVSPQQAKMLLEVLAKNVQAYERQFGVIQTQPGGSLIQPASGIPRI